MRIASAAQRISKIEKSARNKSAYASVQKQRVSRAKERRARAAAENFWVSVQMSYSSPVRCHNACQEGERIPAHGMLQQRPALVSPQAQLSVTIPQPSASLPAALYNLSLRQQWRRFLDMIDISCRSKTAKIPALSTRRSLCPPLVRFSK
jgi:hypothetical protein